MRKDFLHATSCLRAPGRTLARFCWTMGRPAHLHTSPQKTTHCASLLLRGDMATCILAYFPRKSRHCASPLLRWRHGLLHTCILPPKQICSALAHSCGRTGLPAYFAYFAYFFPLKRRKVSITKRHRWYGPRIAKSQQTGYWDKLEKVCKVCKYARGPVFPREWVSAVHTFLGK